MKNSPLQSRWFFPGTKMANFIDGFLRIIEGLARVISLGRWLPGLSLKFCSWGMRRGIKKELERKGNKNG